MTREQLFIIIVAAGAAAGLVWWRWDVACKFWRFWSAPVRDDIHKLLSLARITFMAVIGTILFVLGTRGKVEIGTWPGLILFAAVILSFVNIYRTKETKSISEGLVTAIGGKLPALPFFSKTTETATGEAAVIAAGDSDVPDLPEDDQSG